MQIINVNAEMGLLSITLRKEQSSFLNHYKLSDLEKETAITML